MMSEYEIRFKWLKKIFALYPQFDRLVSCSRQIMEVNREKLSAFAPADKFYFSKNSIDFEKVLSGKEDGRIVKTGDKYFYAVISGTTSVNMRLIPLQPAVKTEIETGSMSVASSADKVDNDYIKFVNIGRLSPEKTRKSLSMPSHVLPKSTATQCCIYLARVRSRRHFSVRLIRSA